jgi:hypothetical protein
MNLIPILFDNPILIRELRRRMRGRALVYSMIGYICLITLVAILIMLGMSPSAMDMANIQNPAGGQNFLSQLINCGTTIFKWITAIQFLLVLIVAPTITAGMTTAEKERKTFEFLQVTTIHPWAYVMGSFLSTVFYVVLALICALPPLCLAFLFGGVAPSDVLETFAILLAGSIILSSFGLYISSTRERTRAAQGVVVFVIFLALFVGTTFLRGFLLYFGTGGVTGSGGNSGLFLFGIAIPMGILVALTSFLLTAVFLLLAARKLYRADERAFTYWQYAVVFLLSMGVMVGLAEGKMVSDANALVFSIVSAVLLVTAAVCFGVGRMEVGDEIWHLKRLLPPLRRIDESIAFLAAVAVLWALMTQWWFRASAQTPATGGLIFSLQIVGVSGFAFFVIVGRFFTMLFPTRSQAGRFTLLVIGLCWVGFPLLGMLIAGVSENLEGMRELLGRFSPMSLMLDFIHYSGQRGQFTNPGWRIDYPGVMQAMAYAMMALGFGIAGELRRWRATRRFDYHFDMPGAE